MRFHVGRSGHADVREKDGLWAVLLWLNILAVRNESVKDIVTKHWAAFGRNYYSRHDYEEVDATAANGLIEHLRAQLEVLPGRKLPAGTVEDLLKPENKEKLKGILLYHVVSGKVISRRSLFRPEML